MSYILEALKKAQAERQLGETPTIHAPTLDVPVESGGTGRKPLAWLVLAMGAVIAVLAVIVWRQSAPAGEPAVATVARAPATVPAAAPVVVAPAPVMPAHAVAPAPAVEVSPPPAKAPSAAVATPPAVAGAKVPAAPAPAAAAVKAEEPAREEPDQAFRDLPEPIQRAIPAIAMSGYMYSPDPADRLILIDKVLRREGDEVAPGVVLVRLEPKGAVFTFRGYRYRMPY